MDRPPPAGLSPRELEVLQLLSRGRTYALIGVEMGVSIGTVQSYIKSIYRKLEVRSKASAAVAAVRLGLV